MCCNEKMRAHHVNHKIQKNLHFVIHFFNILFFHNRKVCMQQVVFIMTFLMRQQQMKIPWRLWVFFLIMYPITTNLFKPPQQYYTIALLERSPLVPHSTLEQDITKATKYVRMKRGNLDDQSLFCQRLYFFQRSKQCNWAILAPKI